MFYIKSYVFIIYNNFTNFMFTGMVCASGTRVLHTLQPSVPFLKYNLGTEKTVAKQIVTIVTINDLMDFQHGDSTWFLYTTVCE